MRMAKVVASIPVRLLVSSSNMQSNWVLSHKEINIASRYGMDVLWT